MARLPQPGSDDGVWGAILNDYLNVIHNADGTLKDGIIQETNLDTAAQAKLNNVGTVSDGSITETKLSTDVVTKLNQSAPVTSVAGKTGAVTLVKGDVGLTDVDNTSDANKPVSTAMQSALDTKADSTHSHAVANVTGLQTALDAKAATTHAHAVEDVTGLQATLDSKAGSTHAHAVSDVTGLQTALDTKAAASSLALVATSGSYDDLTDKPTIPTITASETAPTNPAVGDLWVDLSA